MGRQWVWIIVVSCFVWVSAAAQPGDCEPAALAAAFTQAFSDAVAEGDRSLPYAASPARLLADRYRIDDRWSALAGMSSGSLLLPADAASVPQFWIFLVATEALSSDSPPPTVRLPQTGLIATITSAQPRGVRLRSGPDVQYPQVGTALPGTTLDVVAAVRVSGYDWLNVGVGDDWIRSDLVRVNLPDALTAQRMAVNWEVNSVPYTDAERRERCPLPSALMIQTQPGRVVAYDFNGLTLLQNGTAIITYDNFRPTSGGSPAASSSPTCRGRWRRLRSASRFASSTPV